MRMQRFEMGENGGLVPVPEMPANDRLNNLPAGTVLRWGGNAAWHAQDYAILKREEFESGFGGNKVVYHTVALEDFHRGRVEADGIKRKGDPKVWHSQHFFLTDKVITGDDLLDLAEKAKAKETGDAVAKTAKADAHAAEVARLRKAYPHLIQLTETNRNALVTAAKNLRKELAAAFPGIKFTVKTQRYSGGDNMNVGWTDGPTEKAVDAIADKYTGSDFDGTQDLTTYRDNAWIQVFGDAKYVFVNRHVSEHFRHEAAAMVLGRFAFKFAGDRDPVTADGIDLKAPFADTHCSAWNLGDAAGRLTALCDLTNGIDHLEDEGGEYGRGFFNYLLVGRTAKAAEAKPVNTTAHANAAGVTVTENPMRNGVEVRFAAKPSEAVRAALKADGWRWSRNNGCWYKRQSAEALEFARNLAAGA